MIADGGISMRASRLVSILMMLQTRGRVSARALAEHLEVSTRTVYRDIDELSASGVPVIVERGAAGGFELLEGWRTTLTGLTPTEAQSMSMIGLPGPAMELGLGDTLASAQLKLMAALPRAWQAEAQRVSARFHVDLAPWYRRLRPVEHLRALADAVWADRRVAVEYESWQGPVTRELEPLGLAIKAGDWYLIARPRGGSPRTYRVSNVRALTVGGGFTRPRSFDLAAYWADSTRQFEREIYRGTVRVRLSSRGCRLLRGASAAVEEAIACGTVATDGWLEAAIPMESLGHATAQLLALGAEVEVLEPPELRERLRETALAVAAVYAPPKPAQARRRRRSR